MKITNTQPGPRGVNAVSGPVLIEPGQTWEGEVHARERQHIEASGWFTVEGEYAPDPDAPPAPAKARGDEKDESLTDAIARLTDNAASAKSFEDKVRASLGLKDGEGILEAIDGLKQEIADLQAMAPARTVAQVLAMFDDPDVHFQTAKSEALKVLGESAPQSQTKDDLIAALKAKG